MNVVCANDNVTQDTLTFADDAEDLSVNYDDTSVSMEAENDSDLDDCAVSSGVLSKSNDETVLKSQSINTSTPSVYVGDDIYITFEVNRSISAMMSGNVNTLYLYLNKTFDETEMDFIDYKITEINQYGVLKKLNGPPFYKMVYINATDITDYGIVNETYDGVSYSCLKLMYTHTCNSEFERINNFHYAFKATFHFKPKKLEIIRL